jgi:hypothetical protein
LRFPRLGFLGNVREMYRLDARRGSRRDFIDIVDEEFHRQSSNVAGSDNENATAAEAAHTG